MVISWDDSVARRGVMMVWCGVVRRCVVIVGCGVVGLVWYCMGKKKSDGIHQ